MAGGLIRAGAALASAVALVAAGCPGGDGGGSRPSTKTTIPAEPLVGGTIRLGLPGPLVLDPAAVNPGAPAELMVADLLHDGLTRLGANGEIGAGLARSWSADAGFQSWTFELDEDATLTDGTGLTAEAVAASLTRVAATGPGSLASLRLEAVAGYDELVAGEADTLAGVTVEEGRLRVTTTVPLASLPAILAAPEMGIVAPALLDALDAGAAPSDLGPDELVLSGRWEPREQADGSLTLDRRARADGFMDAVVLHPFDDPAEAYAAFEADEVDWALVPGAAHDDAVAAYGDDHFAPFQAEVFLGLRVTGPPLDNAGLRTAIAAAVDRDALVEAVYSDVADPLGSVVPAGVPGHDPNACGGGPGCGHDPEAAEAALAAAYPDGAVPAVALDFDDTERQARLVEQVAEDLEAVGIPTQLRPRPRADYRAFVASGDQQLFSLGWIGGYVSPDAYLAPLFVSTADDNLTGVADPAIDAALAAARATDDPEAAQAQWRTVERQVLSAAVVIPVAQFRTQAVVANRVQALAHRVDGTVDWTAVWLADAGAGRAGEG